MSRTMTSTSNRLLLAPSEHSWESGKIAPKFLDVLLLIYYALVRTTFINVLFSFVGMDIVAATAAESRALSDAESMKMAARKINLRIITLYSLAVLTASFVVPMDHPFINGGGQSVGSHSVFIIAVVEAGIPSAAHF